MEQAQKKIREASHLTTAIALFAAVVASIFFLPQLLSNSSLKREITHKISQQYGANFTINGRVKIALLPYPSLICEDVLMQNLQIKSPDGEKETTYNFHAKELRLLFPIFNTGNASAKEIIFKNAIFESFDTANPPALRDNNLTKIIDENTKNPPPLDAGDDSGIGEAIFSSLNINPLQTNIRAIPAVKLKNSQVIFYDYLGRKKEVKAINSELKITNKKVEAFGDFIKEELANSFKISLLVGSDKSRIELVSPVLNMRIFGNFTSPENKIFGSQLNGKIEGEINDLKTFYKTYINAESVFFKKLKNTTKPIRFSSDVIAKAGEIDINNLSLTSGIVNGSGDINLDFSEKIPLIDITLQLVDLNLDDIWSSEEISINPDDAKANLATTTSAAATVEPSTSGPAEQVATSKLQEERKIKPLDFDKTAQIKNLDFDADIKIKTVKFLDGEISDVDLYLTVTKQGEVMVQPLLFKIPGDGYFRLNGALDSSTKLPKFVGKIDIGGKKILEFFKWLGIENKNLKFNDLQQYSLYSDILLQPNSSTFSNIYGNLGEGKTEFSGDVKIDNSGKSSNINSRFFISDLRLEDFFVGNGKNVYLSPGSLIKKLFWLNNISSTHNLALHFNKISSRDEEFPNQDIMLKFARGYFELTNLNLRSNKSDLQGNLLIDISDANPRFEVNLASQNFTFSSKNSSTPQDATQLASVPAPADSNPKNFFDQFFALPSLEGFNGKIDLNFKNLTIDDSTIANFLLAGKLTAGNINKAEISCDLYGGNLSYKGLIGLQSSKVFNGNLNFTNVSLKPFLTDFAGITQVAGTANINASLSASADRKSAFGNQLSSEIKFNVNAPSIAGYGLSDLAKKMFAAVINRAELANPKTILLNPQAISSFKEGSGSITIKNGREGKMRASLSAPAINAVFSGAIDPQKKEVDLLFNAIFLSGNRKQPTPINIATNVKGRFNNLAQSTNMSQVYQFLGLQPEDSSDVAIPQVEPEVSEQ